MDNLFEKWKTRIPKYSETYKDLFDSLSKKFGGSEKMKVNLGKHFNTNYELYIYAFFLGLYNGELVPFQDGTKRTDFSHAIQHWGSKGGRIGREDFTSIQENIFAATIAKTDIDLIALEKGELSEDEAVRALISTMESYTNGGLALIREKLDENPNYFLPPTAFLDLILASKSLEDRGQSADKMVDENSGKKVRKKTPIKKAAEEIP